MITTHVHTISSSQTAFASAGLDAYESGPTNLAISFSAVDVNGTYLNMYVKYDNDKTIYTVAPSTDDLSSIKTRSLNKVFYPQQGKYITTYTIDVSGLKTDLSMDRYRINLKLGPELSTEYGKLKIIGSHLYSNKEGSNYCLLTLENDSPRFVSNVIIPFNKDLSRYLPDIPVPFVPNDNVVWRTEILTPQGGAAPVILDGTANEVIGEDQYTIWTFRAELSSIGNQDLSNTSTGNMFYAAEIEQTGTGTPSRAWGDSGLTVGSIANGHSADDHWILKFEDGLDYSTSQEEAGGGPFENDRILNVTIHDIYPGGIAS